jgi:outer membrane protein assembly factor BamC
MIETMRQRARGATAALCTAAALAACTGAFEGKKIDYKSAESKPLPKLEVPPDLATPGKSTRYALPDAPDGRPATYSEYEAARAGKPGTATGATAAGPASASGVLPVSDKVRLERAGSQRWLRVAAPPEEVWPVLREFWQENGFLVAREDESLGLMETDWAENRAKIPRDGLTGMINRALDRVVSSPERDKFRARLERSPDGKATEVYITHKGMAEVYRTADQQERSTIWQVRPTDPELEAEFLQRFATRFGIDDAQAKALVRGTGGATPAGGDPSVATAPQRARTSSDGTTVKLDENFDRAWRRVGLALDRVGFMVEDRNRADGLYFVRYQDPDAPKGKKSALSKLAFWRSDEGPKVAEQYRVLVAAPSGAKGTEVRVVDDQGGTRSNDTAKRIIGLLAEQLR